MARSPVLGHGWVEGDKNGVFHMYLVSLTVFYENSNSILFKIVYSQPRKILDTYISKIK